MGKVFLYCDESGAKGYADNDETELGEVGVFAGILVPEEILATVKPAFDQIAKRYKPAEGKLHIADLPLEQKAGLRNEIFAAIQDAKLPCFWYAVHVAGLHARHNADTDARAQWRAAELQARNGAEPRFKRGSPREDPLSLHVLLFEGLYDHLVAFLAERGRRGVDIQVRMDQVDKPIVKAFRQGAEELLDNDPRVYKQTAFDVEENQTVTGSIAVKTGYLPELDFSSVVESLTIETMPDSDGLVLVADVLAHSLNHHFMRRSGEQLYAPLNCRDAVAGHPLAANLDAFINWGDDPIGDGMYAHPLRHPRA